MSYIETELTDGVLLIAMNRPDRLNAIGVEMAADFIAALDRLDGDSEIRTAVITGRGRAFTAGLDLKERIFGPQGGAELVDAAMGRVKKPLIAAVNGMCLGGGLKSIVMKSDLRVAASHATFGMPEVKMPARMAPYDLLAQGIPMAVAMELALLGETIGAERAYNVGILNAVVPADRLLPTAFAFAEKIKALDPEAAPLIHQAGTYARRSAEENFRKHEPVPTPHLDRNSPNRLATMQRFKADKPA